jgi:hypothetical protein
MKLVLLKKQD